MKKVLFLASGGGGNLKFIHTCVQNKLLPNHDLSGLIVDRDCGALQFAQQKGIPSFQIQYDKNDRKTLSVKLGELKPDLIITNIHKILDPEIVRQYSGKLINLHYSLLPAFGGTIGTKPVQQAMENGCQFTGATVHFVSDAVDAGQILAQAVMPIIDGLSLEKNMDQVFRLGCLSLLNVLMILDSAPANIFKNGSESLFNPPLRFDPAHFNEDFWTKLK